MRNSLISEEEIEAVEKLRSHGEYAKALKLTQEMLEHAEDGDARMRLLFNIVTCSAFLELGDLTDSAMKELDRMAEPEFSRALANMSRAHAEEQLGRPEKALALLDMNLETGYFERDDFRIHKYQLCLFKGQALTRLRRAAEALEWLDRAHGLCPSEDGARDETERRIFGWVEPLVQINRANCLMALGRFEEAFQAASEVLRRTDRDLATLATQHIAECLVWQGRVQEALELYVGLKRRLPCRLVDEKRIQTGITNCMSHLERRRAITKPS